MARSHPDNSPLENFFNIMENEMFYGRDWEGVSLEELGKRIDDYIEWYSTKRIMRSLGSMSPVPSIVFRTFVSQGPVPVAGASSVS